MTTFMPAAKPRGQTRKVCPNRVAGTGPVDRWELLALVTDLRRELGLTDRDISVLRAHLTVLPRGDLVPGRVNTSFMEVTEILNRACGMEERRFRRGETRLAQAGLVLRRLSANGRRFPERDASGAIVNAYGIDLNPLLAMVGELTELQERRHENELRVRHLKNAVSARLQNMIRRFAPSASPLPVWLETLRARVRSALRRKSLDVPQLQALQIELESSETQFGDDTQHDEASAPDGRPAPPETHSTETASDTRAVDAGQTVRHIESPPKEDKETAPCRSQSNSVSHAWHATEVIKDFYPNPPVRDHELAAILVEFSSFLGLGQSAFERGLSCLGWDGMITALDYLARKVGSVSKPGGYFSAMIAAFERGEPIANGRIRPAVGLDRRRSPAFAHVS